MATSNNSQSTSRRKFIRNISITGIGAAGVAVFLDKFTRVFEGDTPYIRNCIEQSFRLTDHRSLLNLEYYFINCHYHIRKKKIIALYGPHENFMIVRLPQQHIAETSFTPTEATAASYIRAATYISGYSYLVFRILFPQHSFFKRLGTLEDGEVTDVHMGREDLLDWGCEEKFRLVVRQDLAVPIFETENIRRTINKSIIEKDNHYPFQQVPVDSDKLGSQSYRDSLSNDSLRINKIPKVYGDPVTAIELPWRLIISPKLPDSRKYKFKWEIPDTYTGNTDRHLLWTATLSITERTDSDYQTLKAHEQKEKENTSNAGSTILNEAISQLEIMILGSPDYRDGKGNISNKVLDKVLPQTWHRDNLVALYIKLRLLARTDKIVFSPFGATASFHLKNNDIEEGLRKGIEVLEWNHVISFGQDEKVEVATLFLEAEFGHKMVYIKTTQRQLIKGVYALIKRDYLMPLDISKDFSNHVTQVNTGADKNGINSRFGSPFKKITFLEAKPKQLLPEGLVFNRKDITYSETYFAFEAIDWHDQVINFNKKINSLPIGASIDDSGNGTAFKDLISDNKSQDVKRNIPETEKIVFKPAASILSSTTGNANTADLDNLIKKGKSLAGSFEQSISKIFSGLPVTDLDRVREKVEEAIEISKSKLVPEILDPTMLYKKLTEKYLAFNNRLERNFQILIESWSRQELIIYNDIQAFHEKVVKGLDIVNKDFFDFLKENEGAEFDNLLKTFKELKNLDTANVFYLRCKGLAAMWKQQVLDRYTRDPQINQLLDDFGKLNSKEEIVNSLLNAIITESPAIAEILKDIATIKSKIPAAAAELLTGLRQNIKDRIDSYREVEELVKKIPNIIMLKRQKIGYAIKQAISKEKQEIIDRATNAAKKSLSELESEYIIFKGKLREAEMQAFDFFHEHAIIPEVQQAKVYVSSLNRLLSDEIPININYAREYLDNQFKDLEFEAKENAAMLFAEVQQSSRDQVSGLVRKLGEKMPGMNVELPIHYLTYLQNPRAADTAVLKELGYSIKDLEMIKEASKDLVFIGEGVKNAIKTVQDLENVDPKAYFKKLGAKLFGSIGLEDILGVGFDLPRVTELPDRIIYQFSTDRFKEAQLAFVAFKPGAGRGEPTKLDLFISKSLIKANEFYAYTKLNNFSVSVVIGGTEVITILFDSFKISQTPGNPKKTDISISDIKMGGVLEFISEIAKKFQAPGNGMLIKPGPRQLDLSYGITLPNISAPAFNLKNLQLNIGVNIPYDPSSVRPISFTAGLNSFNNKFLISAGIYGGRGHIQLRATPKGVEMIDMAMEMGAYAGLDLGIGKGEVFLFFGIWFMCGRDPDSGENMVKAVAYVLAAGSAVVLGFISIGVRVMISLTYIKRGKMSLMFGEAIVTYSVKIAFFKKEFSIRYYKEIAGSGEGNQSSGTNTQLAFIGGVLSGEKKKTEGEEKKEFEEVFENNAVLNTYIDCFTLN